MSAVEWCRPVGRLEVLGLRAKADYARSGPRPWAAAWVAANAGNDQWLFEWVNLLIKMHELAAGFAGSGNWKRLVVKNCLLNDFAERFPGALGWGGD